MQHLRGFEISVLPVTNTKPRRVKIFDTRHEVRTIISWNYDKNTSAEIAIDYLKSQGIEIIAYTYNEKEYRYTLLTDNFRTTFNTRKPGGV